MSHFYLTLPSNSSEKYYQNNTLTHFFTKLHNDISLNGEWEAALVEIMYPRNWYNVDEQYMIVKCEECDGCVDTHVTEDVIDYELQVRVPSGYYSTMEELIEMLNNAISKEFSKDIISPAVLQAIAKGGKTFRVDEKLWPRFRYYKPSRHVYLSMQAGMTVTLTNKLAMILGLETETYASHAVTVRSNLTSDIEGGLHAMYVYCDLLECVPVGDTAVPLLRIVKVGGQRDEMVQIEYDQPRYFPLQKKVFDSVEIDIRDDTGEHISFDSGKLIVTLHFRRAKDSYFL